MAVPDFQTMMLPFLRLVSDGSEHTFGVVSKELAEQYKLTEAERTELVPSGRQSRLLNRIYWISTHFKNARLIEFARRGAFRITPRGLNLLAGNPTKIDLKLLLTFPEYVEFRSKKSEKSSEEASSPTGLLQDSKTPDELLFESYQTIRASLASEIIEKIKSCPPSFFERLVVELLVKMGTAVREKMRAKLLERVEMVESTVLSKKIDWGLMLSTFKPSGGKEILAVRRFKNLLELY